MGCYRFDDNEMKLLEQLSAKLGVSIREVIRRADAEATAGEQK